MPTIQLQTVFKRSDPLLSFRWKVQDVPFGQKYGIGPEYVETFEIPFNNVKAENVFRGGGFVYFPGFHDVSAFNVTFYGDCDGQVLAWLMHWKSRVKNFNNGIYSLPGNYKMPWTVDLLDPAGGVAITIVLEGRWPADTANISLDSDSSTRLTFNQDFSVDNCKVLGAEQK